ncbi:MAG: GspE/PulE family protein [Ezakiella sp.]|nr:GspE/PulE family protein [Ezakiella sp.]
MDIKYTQALRLYLNTVGVSNGLNPAVFLHKIENAPIVGYEDGNAIKEVDGLKILLIENFKNEKYLMKLEDKIGPFLYMVDEEELSSSDASGIIRDAIRMRATDIHIEPKKSGFDIRFRIDGILRDTNYQNINYNRLVNSIKVMSGMDVINKEIQDGSIEMDAIAIRVNSVPSIYGEKLALRLLNSSGLELDLKMLGMDDNTIKAYDKIINKEGLNLVCGPTGSGKNTTLHAALKRLPLDIKNAISIEDPVEYREKNMTQLEVDPLKNRDFNNLLRASLRQDPDILYIGEIRDELTAQVALRSAITGHTVFSTLHTKSKEATIDRLLDLGVGMNMIKDGLKSIISQRLVPRLCDECKEERDGHFIAKGCDKCYGGYRGRIAIFDVNIIKAEDGIAFENITNFTTSLKRLYDDGFIDLKAFEVEDDI